MGDGLNEMRGLLLRHSLVRVRCKITDRPSRSVRQRRELTEDEAFFEEHDVDPAAALIEGLERDREMLQQKEDLGKATPEWQEYEAVVEAAIDALESEWLTRPEPITKETVRQAREKMEEVVLQVQRKHQQLNDQRIEAYERYKSLLTDGKVKHNEAEMPVSQQYAKLL